jgi:hypothetical protein
VARRGVCRGGFQTRPYRPYKSGTRRAALVYLSAFRLRI